MSHPFWLNLPVFENLPHLIPNSIAVDGVLLFSRMGAYSATSGSSFNGIDPAGIVMIWRDAQGQLHFQKSPFFDRGKVLLNSLP